MSYVISTSSGYEGCESGLLYLRDVRVALRVSAVLFPYGTLPVATTRTSTVLNVQAGLLQPQPMLMSPTSPSSKGYQQPRTGPMRESSMASRNSTDLASRMAALSASLIPSQTTAANARHQLSPWR